MNLSFDNIYITGDIHGSIARILEAVGAYHTTQKDLLIILGDVGFNYYLDSRDSDMKQEVSKLPITLLCIHGNHEERPENISTYQQIEFCGDFAYYEPEYPNIIFAKDGGIYNLNGTRCLVLGGAYSVDKFYRLERGWRWFPSEQITDARKYEIEQILEDNKWRVDYVLSHTCPYDERPVHLFLRSVDQSQVDTSMEMWLQKIADKLNFKRWYFGHYHGDWDNGRYTMFYTNIEKFPYEPMKDFLI